MADDENQKQEDAPLQSDQEQTKQEDPSDRLTPDHPRFKEVLDRAKTAEGKVEDLQIQLDELKTRVSDRQEETGSDELTLEEQNALERIDKGLKARGYITKEELEVDKRAGEYRRLGEKYDGSNGLPKFEAVDIEAYSKRNGFGSNYEAAYKDMHFDAFVQHQAKQSSEKMTPPTQEKASGGERQQAATEFTPEAIASMSDEEYEKNRDKILGGVKASVTR